MSEVLPVDKTNPFPKPNLDLVQLFALKYPI